MSDASLARFEELLADALLARDPAAALRAASADPDLPDVLRRTLARADADGVRLTALIVVRLRFERLLQGSSKVAEEFERDPAGLVADFREYHHGVRPSADHPHEEARAFLSWRGDRVRREVP